jgi:hypothetical protein
MNGCSPVHPLFPEGRAVQRKLGIALIALFLSV